MISYDDFAKLDIRLGTILSAEPIPDADKLLRLVVDVGEPEPRQILAGIRAFIEPENLVGKQCPFIVNLEPRTLRGFESNGMLLAASVDETLALLHPSQELPAGAKVR